MNGTGNLGDVEAEIQSSPSFGTQGSIIRSNQDFKGAGSPRITWLPSHLFSIHLFVFFHRDTRLNITLSTFLESD